MNFPSFLKSLLSPLIFLCIVLLSSCSSALSVEGVDLEVWKADRDACKGERGAYIETLRPIKNDFLAADNQALLKTFGRPDRVELVDRSQNFFIYYMEPSPRCEGSEAEEEEVLKLIFRLNAYSRVSEVIITRLNPGD